MFVFIDNSVELNRAMPDFNLQPWHSCHKLIYVRPNPKTGVPIGHWPIPESFWPDQNTPTLVSRETLWNNFIFLMSLLHCWLSCGNIWKCLLLPARSCCTSRCEILLCGLWTNGDRQASLWQVWTGAISTYPVYFGKEVSTQLLAGMRTLLIKGTVNLNKLYLPAHVMLLPFVDWSWGLLISLISKICSHNHVFGPGNLSCSDLVVYVVPRCLWAAAWSRMIWGSLLDTWRPAPP